MKRSDVKRSGRARAWALARESGLIIDGLATLVAASLAIRLLPFRATMTLAGYRGATDRAAPAAIIARCRWVVNAWAERVPWRAKCFERGLALHWLLRRRGVASVFHYGIANDAAELSAHVWISVADAVVLGEGIARGTAKFWPGPDATVFVSPSPPYRYALFGLTVASELELAGLPPAESPKDDVIVRRGPVAPPPGAGPGYAVDDAGAFLIIPEVGDFRIERGADIVIAPAPGGSDRNVRLYLLGSAMGALLHQRGIVPLHANAIVAAGRAVAFMGHSGAGKSTLAGWFHDRGHAILSDDVCAVSFAAGGGPMVAPGIPRLRLWRDALDRSGRSLGDYELSFDGQDKYDVPIDAPALAAAPLAAVYLLERDSGAKFAIEPLAGMAAVDALVANTYRGGYLRLAGATGNHLARCVALARATPVFRVRRAWDTGLLDRQAELLAAHALG